MMAPASGDRALLLGVQSRDEVDWIEVEMIQVI